MIVRPTLLAAADLGLWTAAAWGPVPDWAAALCHAALTLAALRLAIGGPAPVAMVAAAALGPVALLPARMIARLSGRGRRAPRDRAQHPAHGPLDAHAHGPAADRRLTDRIADDRLHSPDAAAIAHFTDLLRHGDLAMRQRVVTAVVRNFTPRLSGIVAMALVDRDQSIRTQAASAVAEIERDLACARAALAARPDRAAAWALAELLADHVAHNRLLSEPARTAMRAAAIAGLDALAASRAHDAIERLAIARRQARLLVADGRAHDAVALLDPLVDARAGTGRGLAELVDALVAARGYDRLAALAAAAADRTVALDPPLAERLAYWHRPRAA